MSPAGTMARVYQALKARVMAGEFAAGERIDPARLSAELAASATPIREALHRLAGERLVESWSQEGFRQPFLTEAGLRDLYGWSEDLLRMLFRAAERHGLASAPVTGPTGNYAAATAALFAQAAALSPNLEHRAAIASLNERCHALRLAEARLLPDAWEELEAFSLLLAAPRWTELRRWSGRYHAARLRRVPELAADVRRP